ncbi:NAD(P)H-quinone oxidoreductase [Kutzneria sp. CA-103260]|uniref:NAD(P)H-quinone oxidoreductase n=1 Tax=Kutzneria sp. CA-103260 TaxID=2802641 RepID=UPI001BAE332D|nr:NAD(P)H-quinone oxidoreductase [Kutzneria sp. CA-103260]QUQ69827.1 NADPH:quinone reductase-dependent oxidoreductase [Kutzneria sp. CA-103260]
MHAITIRQPGGPEVLEWAETPDPVPGPGEVLLDVAATAVNRADLLQRQGFYPPPKGASEILGLECSGTIAAVGDGVEGWQPGDEVCALLAGGGYAEKVAVPAPQLLPVPKGVSLVDAAGLPEVVCTVWSTVVQTAGLAEGDVLLVHGGAGGIGTCAIQIGKALGATVAVTAGSQERLDKCRELGADIAVNYKTEDFVEEVRKATDGHGADVVLDNMGASYLPRNIDVLAMDGRVVVIGFQGGVKGELNIGALLAKRGGVYSAGLRARPVTGKGGKADIIADVRDRLWPLVESGAVKPIIGRTLPMAQAADAHRALEASDVFGKLVLTA